MATDLGLVHPLTGPVYVNGAEPGDLLEVNILSIEPASWGFTSILPGFGFLRDLYLEPYIVHWRMNDGFATSEQLPGVRVPEASFMGTIGVAPSRALRQEILLREDELLRRGGMVVGPTPGGAVPAQEPFASEGLRTIPPREHGGNVDIKQLTAGTRLMLPVFTEGALFSAGDAHYAQGDSECCGTAIEMDCTLHVSFRVRKGEAASRRINFPYFERDDYFTSPEMAAPRRFIASTGMCIADGVNESENGTLASRQALLKHDSSAHGARMESGAGVLHLQPWRLTSRSARSWTFPTSWSRHSCRWIFSKAEGTGIRLILEQMPKIVRHWAQSHAP